METPPADESTQDPTAGCAGQGSLQAPQQCGRERPGYQKRAEAGNPEEGRTDEEAEEAADPRAEARGALGHVPRP